MSKSKDIAEVGRSLSVTELSCVVGGARTKKSAKTRSLRDDGTWEEIEIEIEVDE